ncbi:MAG: HAMP domain-containing protein [Desulfobacterales bacterium]|nr:HAMP domain-containing protein [Desulfobacterales bacterium]
MARIVFSVFLLVLLMTFVLAFRLTKRLLKPIHDLSAATRRISQGDYGVELRSDRVDEIGELMIAFRRMAQDIQDRQIDLVALIENTSSAVALFDERGSCAFPTVISRNCPMSSGEDSRG